MKQDVLFAAIMSMVVIGLTMILVKYTSVDDRNIEACKAKGGLMVRTSDGLKCVKVEVIEVDDAKT